MSFSNTQLAKKHDIIKLRIRKNNKNMSFSNTQSTKKHVIIINFMTS